jgi:hypothetical protein
MTYPRPTKICVSPNWNVPVGELGRPQHYEERLAVDIDLGPLVRAKRVLDREFVQTELPLDALQDIFARFMQPDPHEAVWVVHETAALVDIEIGYAPAILVPGAGNHHAH